MMKQAVVALCLAALVAGCGSSKHASTSVTPPKVLPNARTPDEWARRVVSRLLRPLNNDLRVVNGFSSPQIRSYIVTQNQTTISTIRTTMNDLKRCTTKLDVIGPPPADAQLRKVNASLRTACAAYVQVATGLLRATDLLSSGRQDGVEQGDKELRKIAKPSQDAAADLVDAVRTAQNVPAFRRAGLKPSV